MESSIVPDAGDTAIALIGMAGRFPGASDVGTFWQNVMGGVTSIRNFSEQELLAAGVSAATLAQPNYVKAGTEINELAHFDAAFFGYTRREAEIMDPQHRLFLECAWQALEDAACVPETYPGLIGVFAGSSFSTYAAHNLYTHPELVAALGELPINLGNELDSLTSTVSYKLNLKGPSIAVQTYCSTSLVAVHLACRSLATYECDTALAGGVAITIPQLRGYVYEEGSILSPDGVCRTFDRRARGSVMGNGVGVVVLKRLNDALKDGDHIYALIRGSAVNNDGGVRVSYTAPSLGGQAEVIAEALGNADVAAETIGYIEAHGTGTMLGDAVELAAMLKAFGSTSQQRFCALGSVKPNIGHLDRASGVTGLIKASLALYHKQLPPSLNFECTNADIDLEQSPFYVNTTAQAWLAPNVPRRAGVSSFGLGGTNAHVILEEAPVCDHPRSISSALLVLSARTSAALTMASTNLVNYLRAHPQADLADVAYTLQVGRSAFSYRSTLLCRDRAEAITRLEQSASTPELFIHQTSRARQLTFLFSAKADLRSDLALALYQQVPLFRVAVDACCQVISTYCQVDSSTLFTQPEYTLWATFVGKYALARMYQGCGIQPQAVLGVGIGLYAAACIVNILLLKDALLLLAMHLYPQRNIVSPTKLVYLEPSIPCVAGATGQPLSLAQANDVAYWHSLLTDDAHGIAESVGQVLQGEEQVLFSIGTQMYFRALIEQYAADTAKQRALQLPALSLQPNDTLAWEALLTTLGRLWEAGVNIDWMALASGQGRQRLSLPTYPFERQKYWIDPPLLQQAASVPKSRSTAVKLPDIADWSYLATWQQTALPVATPKEQQTAQAWLVFVDAEGFGELLAQHLRATGAHVVQVYPRDHFGIEANGTYGLRPGEPQDYVALCEVLFAEKTRFTHILHCWSLTHQTKLSGPLTFQAFQERGFYSVLFLAQALAKQSGITPLDITILTTGLAVLQPGEQVIPEQHPLVGACKVIAQEHTNQRYRVIDVALSDVAASARCIDSLLAELQGAAPDPVVAYRDQQRWVQFFQPLPLAPHAHQATRFRQRGVYLLTGGFGKVSRVLTAYLARTYQARLVLLGRSPLPAREDWSHWLVTHDISNQVSQRIQYVQHLEALGAEVLPLQVDVADVEQFCEAVNRATAHFGTLHGVIYAATVGEQELFRLVQDTSQAACEQHFSAKAYGLYALDQALKGQKLDFCVLFSSISAVLGGLSLVGYTAANLFMDAFVQWHNQQVHTFPWISINWDTWQVQESDHGVLGGSISPYTLTPAEGCEALERILVHDFPQTILSTGDLAARVRQWILLEGISDHDRNNDHLSAPGASPVVRRDEYERILTTIWQDVLGVEQVGLAENFFDLGGNSLSGLQVIAHLRKALQVQLPIVALFEAPTIYTMMEYLQTFIPQPAKEKQPYTSQLEQRRNQARKACVEHDIALVAMTGRFPGATDVEQFWQNLRAGVESIASFTDEELQASGVAQELLHAPNYVRARPILEDVGHFDAAFFGYSPREAELLDPQHRLFLECCWEVLERAGYDPHSYEGLIGVFGGANISTYLHTLLQSPEVVKELQGVVNGYQISVSADKDSLTTAVSYKLNLRGPSLAVQTFCSTSLVAVHLACQSLRHGECDMVLAGGVSVHVPVKEGHLYEEGGQESPDGHCRTFDARAGGSMFGDGVGVVMLKRLNEALEDGDQVLAVIRGTAINNDGAMKVSYAAPSVVGQSEVVLAALEDAGVSAESISYVEAHGTATKLGDPIEVAALTKAYRSHTQDVGYCAIGSVKTNVGHLDRAAGVSGLIKTVLSLQAEELPASLHYEQPNPEIDFAQSPFVVNAALRSWPRQAGRTRRAGVNSLGMGGTNAHVIVEEAPERVSSGPARPWQLLPLSAKTASALEQTTQRLANHLREHEEQPLADIAYTLQVGRQRFEHRRVLVGRSHAEALQLLEQRTPGQVWSHQESRIHRPSAFLFPGLGELYPGMARELYTQEPIFRECIDHCCRILEPYVGLDLRQLLCANERPASEQGQKRLSRPLTLDTYELSMHAQNGDNAAALRQTLLAQPAAFVLEYALAQLLMQWGLQPQVLCGYSIGEYVAACLAGVFSLDEALLVVARRAQLIQEQPTGAMMAVAISEELASSYLSEEVSLAAVNTPGICILAGSPEALALVIQDLEKHDLTWRWVEATHAFHSRQMQPLGASLLAVLRTVKLKPPHTPYLSNVTGTWITAEQATDPNYWVQHLCQTVRFSAGIAHLLQEGEYAFFEVGVGHVLSSYIKQHPFCNQTRAALIFPTLPAIYEPQSEAAFLLTTLGKAWLAGVAIDWQSYAASERRQRVLLPTYPFERQRYWIDGQFNKQLRLPQVFAETSADPIATLVANDGTKPADLADWFYLPSWKRSVSLPSQVDVACADLANQCWLLFVDDGGLAKQLATHLRCLGKTVITVAASASFFKRANHYHVRPTEVADYESMLKDLRERACAPTHIVHLWSVGSCALTIKEKELDRVLAHGFYSLLSLTQALGNLGLDHCHMTVVSSDMYDVTGTEDINVAKATLLGPCKVIPQEYPGIVCRSIDLAGSQLTEPGQNTHLIQHILAELTSGTTETVVAWRGQHRWVQMFEPVRLLEPPAPHVVFRQRGVYLITGGLGGIGLAMAEHLAQTVQARLVLLGRSALPPRTEWPTLLASDAGETTVTRQIRSILRMEEYGADVLLLQADVCNEVQMCEALHSTLQTFGELHGVLHIAGVPASGLVQLKTREMAERTLGPKVRGTQVLGKVLQELPLDFLVLFSSVCSTTGGGPGQVDYCAANAFLDAYAHKYHDLHGRTVALDWSEWQWNAWEEGLQGYPQEAQQYFRQRRQHFGISFAEGFETLTRALTYPLSQIIISSEDFQRMVLGSQNYSINTILRDINTFRETYATTSYTRPVLGSEYVPPDGELEQEIAALWRELLGIGQIGRLDNFFELGGHSLMGTQLIARLRRTLGVDIRLSMLFEAPTIADLAVAVELSLIDEIEQSSEEEAECIQKTSF